MSRVDARTNTFTSHVSRLHACVTHPSTPSAKREDCDAILPSPFIHQNASLASLVPPISHENPPDTHARWSRKIFGLQHACFVTFSPSHAKEITRQKWRCLVIRTHTRTFVHLESDFGENNRILSGTAYKATRALRLFFSVQFFVFFFPRVSRLRRWDSTLNARHSEWFLFVTNQRHGGSR